MYKRSSHQDRAYTSTDNSQLMQDGGMRLQIKSVLLQILRFLLYKSTSLLRTCRNLTAQMWFNTQLQNLYSSLSRRVACGNISEKLSSKKILIFALVLLIILLYMWPNWLTWPSRTISVDPMDMCLDAKLQKYKNSIASYNAIVNHVPLREDENKFFPFIGNGYIGCAVRWDEQLYVSYGRTLSVPVNYYPIASVHIEGMPSKEAFMTDVLSGIVYKIQCFQYDTVCITVTSHYYTHRMHPSVMVQEFHVANPTDVPVTLEFRLTGSSDWQGSVSRNGKTVTGRNSEVEYQTVMGTVPLDQFSQPNKVAVAITHTKIHDALTVKPSASSKRHIYTAVRHDLRPETDLAIDSDLAKLAEATETDLKNVLNIESNMLRSQHAQIWESMWGSGFGISMSRAIGALNGDKINMTMYYVMCNYPSASPSVRHIDRDTREAQELSKHLYFPENCYDGHHTLQNSIMWEQPTSVQALLKLVSIWTITLDKHSCSSLLRAGAEGVLQAMVLSFGALRFKNSHLEFGAHPSDLHRDYFFRRLNYGNNTHVNISVVIGDDNKANLLVALDRNDKPYYACEAGCRDPPIKLSNELINIPVKITNPQTAILYITFDKQHMEELKHAIHFDKIEEAPANEHHIMALHRHGHHYGGLPMLFWISIGFLILVFHLFLFKLIFNEYCQSNDTRYIRGKYSL